MRFSALIQIDEFPDGEEWWRVDMLGAITWRPLLDSEPRITAGLTQLNEAFEDPLLSNSRKRNAENAYTQRSCSFGVGDLPFVAIGSAWHGQCVDHEARGADPHLLALDTAAGVETTVDGSLLVDGERFQVLPPSHFPLGSNFREMAKARLLVFEPATPFLGCCRILIPEIELLRFYYFSSSATFGRIWEGCLTDAIDPTESALLEGGDIRVSLQPGYSDDDAWFIARWLSSPVMQEQVRRIHRVQAAAAVNHVTGERKTHVEVGFPFEGRTQLAVRGKRILMKPRMARSGKKADNWTFLVTEILRCSHPLDFQNVICVRKHGDSSMTDPLSDDLPAVYLRSGRNHVLGNDDRVRLRSNEPPSTQLRRAQINLFQKRFSSLEGKRLIKETKEVEKHRSARIIRTASAIATVYGTGEPTTGASGTGPLVISVKPTSKMPPSVDLEDFIHTLEALRSSPTIVSIDRLSLTADAPEDGLYTFPTRGFPWNSWRFIDGRPRRAVIAEVQLAGGRSIYALELERKGKETFASLLLANIGWNRLSPNELKLFMFAVAEDRGWPDERQKRHLRQRRVKHAEGRTAQASATEILSRLRAWQKALSR